VAGVARYFLAKIDRLGSKCLLHFQKLRAVLSSPTAEIKLLAN
jgi:hypothetical protein